MSGFEDRMDQNAGAVDDLYGDLFTGGWEGQVEEPDRMEVGFDLLPRFNFYLLKTEGFSIREAKTKQFILDGKPLTVPGQFGIHFAFSVLRGPAGTEGRKVYDDLYLGVNPVGVEKNSLGQAAAYDRKKRMETLKGGGQISEYDKATNEMKRTLTRLKNHLRYGDIAPAGGTKDAFHRWALQWVDKEAIFAVSVEKGRKNAETGEPYDDRNRIIWRSAAHPDAFVIDKKTGQATQETYRAAMEKEIAAYVEKAAKGDGKAKGATAGGSFGPSKPTSYFGG